MNGRTPFRPQTDAFAFDNAWPIDGDELEEIRSYLAPFALLPAFWTRSLFVALASSETLERRA